MNKPLSSREVLIYFYLKDEGDWNKMYQDIIGRADKNIDDEEIQQALSQVNTNDFITLLDKEYPKDLKRSYHPPMVMKKGGLKTYDFVIITTFRKHVSIQADSEERARDMLYNSEDFQSSTDTLDFDTEIELVGGNEQ